jgi:hypothetical protein
MPLPKQSRQDSFFYEPRDEPALKRMRFLNGRWDQLNWYVELIAKDLSRLSKGEWTILQEEVVAIHRTLSNNPKAKTPERQALVDFQAKISRHFSHLRSGVLVEIGQLKIIHEIKLVSKSSSKESRPFSLEQFFNRSLEDAPDVEVRYTPRLLPVDDWRSYLLDHFGRLLGELGASIRRCPHCSKWFLQFRKSAQYCGRTCQNRAGAEAARARERIAKAKQKRAKAPLKKSTQRKRR